MCHCERSEAISKNGEKMFENNCLNPHINYRFAFKYFCFSQTDCFVSLAMTDFTLTTSARQPILPIYPNLSPNAKH